MKQIEAFVDSIYRNVGGNKKEIFESKTEMRNHLLETVHELKLEGKSENEAINIAIERFGGQEEMRSIVHQLFKDQKAFAKWMFQTSLVILLITVLLFSVFITFGNKRIDEQSRIAYKIGDMITNQDTILKSQKNKIRNLINDTSYISEIRIYKTKDLGSSANLKTDTANYKYSRKTSKQYPLLNQTYYYGVDKAFVVFDTFDYRQLAFTIFIIGFPIYWLLFLIWAIINAYHQKRLNVGWSLIFIMFNIVGYAIFKLANKEPKIF
ncbi:permease prefix domain 1-containing protein [Priestia megaterium]|uniref:permease prefix domain 1-containing protein n=1 Tax=Priestia megaterium TaxID=1404 RepID=UPI003459AB5A